MSEPAGDLGFFGFLFLVLLSTLVGGLGLHVGIIVLHEALPAVQRLTVWQSLAGAFALSVVKGIPPLRVVRGS